MIAFLMESTRVLPVSSADEVFDNLPGNITMGDIGEVNQFLFQCKSSHYPVKFIGGDDFFFLFGIRMNNNFIYSMIDYYILMDRNTIKFEGYLLSTRITKTRDSMRYTLQNLNTAIRLLSSCRTRKHAEVMLDQMANGETRYHKDPMALAKGKGK